MKVVKTEYENPSSDIIDIACEVLTKGGVIIYPTDTVYGIGCLLNEESVKRVQQLKHRSQNMPLSVAIPKRIVSNYVEVSQELQAGPITYICMKKSNVPDYVTAKKQTVGVRIFDSGVVGQIVSKVSQPLITTSANISGDPAPKEVCEITDNMLKGVDLIIDTGKCAHGKPSKIIDLTDKGKIIRE